MTERLHDEPDLDKDFEKQKNRIDLEMIDKYESRQNKSKHGQDGRAEGSIPSDLAMGGYYAN